MCYSPGKGQKRKTTSFDDAPQTVYRGSRVLKIAPVPRNNVLIAHENGQKSRKRRVLTTQLKTCTGGTGLETRPQTKKQCALAKKNVQKRQNRRVFASPLEPCTVDHGLENRPQTQKTVCYGSGKRPDNTKTTRFDDAPQIM